MSNDILLNILFNTKQELEKTLNLTDEEIQKQAIEYFKKNLSFILDTNLANFDVANKNILRALKRGYQIEIFYIFREYQSCKNMTKIREKKEGRVVGDEVFNKKAIGSLETFKQLLNEYKNNDNINLTIIDLEDNIIVSKNDTLQIDTKLNNYRKKLNNYLNQKSNYS